MSPRTPTLPPSNPFTIVYDLRAEGAWTRARKHRDYWGNLYTDATVLDNNHVALTFRPAPDSRWRAWEKVRKSWIMEDMA